MTEEAQIAKDDAKRRIHNLVEDYFRILYSGKKDSFNKERVKIAFVEPLFEALGWNEQASGIGIIEYGLDLIFTCKRNKMFVRVLGLDESLEGHSGHGRSYVEQAFHVPFNMRADWLVLTNFVETRLYDCRERKPVFAAMKESQPLWKMKFDEYESKFEDLWLFSREGVVSGALNAYAHKEKVTHKPEKTPMSGKDLKVKYAPISRDRHEWIDVSGPLHGDGHIIRYFRCTRCGIILRKQYEPYPRTRRHKTKVARTHAKYTPLRKERTCQCGKLFYYQEAWESHKKECHEMDENQLHSLPNLEDEPNNA